MAGYPPPPPPYGPPPSAPFGYDPRQQQRFMREQMKAQTRAQKAAFDAQRALYRAQTRGLRRSSILGPLLVLTIGIVALLLSSGWVRFGTFANWYQRWWPVLIVAAGALLVAEWGFDQWRVKQGSPIVRRGIGGGGVLLLCLLIGFGFASEATHNGERIAWSGINFGSGNLEEVFGEKYEREQTIDQTFPAGTALAVDNPHGDVTITGKSGDDMIHVTVSKILHGHSEQDADGKAQILSPRLELVAGVMRMTVPSVEGGEADLSITVPESSRTTVNANRGDVRLATLRASVEVTTNHGDIDVNSIVGGVIARNNSSGSSFTAHNVTGDVTMKGRADNLSLTDVGGQVTLEGEFFGDTHLERLHAPVTFHTSRTHLQVARLEGSVDISSDSALSGSDIVGPTQLRTRSRNISLERVTGSIDVSNTNGSVDITQDAPLGNVIIDNRDGAVNYRLPEHSGVTIDAEAREGQVENDLALSPVKLNDNTELHGTVGNGANRVSIHTTHADIDIHKSVSAVAAPAPPAPKTSTENKLR